MVSLPDLSKVPCRDSSVAFGDDAAILASFATDGYVVVTGVISHDDVNSAINELWTSHQLLGRSDAIKRDDPSTWQSGNWPQQDGGRNFLESCDPYLDRSCWDLPQHPNVVHVLRLLYRGPVFAPESARHGVMRPTAEHPEWRTDANWLHWDQSPWRQPGFHRVQCFLCLSDQTPTSGGFLCAPGAHNEFAAWGEEHPEGTVVVGGKTITRDYGVGAPFPVPLDDPFQHRVVRVLAPQGALVLWDGRLPHQNYPNTGPEFRVVQYLSFSCATPDAVEERREFLQKKLLVRSLLDDGPEPVQCFFPGGLSALGREIFCVPDGLHATGVESLDSRLVQAIRLTIAAGDQELRGELQASVQSMQRAGKLWPEIEAWHDAIFGI